MAQKREYQRRAMGPNSSAISEGDQIIISGKGEMKNEKGEMRDEK
jgi:hypothetical protein